MKILLSAAVLLTLSGTAFASAEVAQDTIPGYGVQSNPASLEMAQIDLSGTHRSEPVELTIPGYGVTSSEQYASNTSASQTEIGSFEVDYLGMSFQGAN